MSRVRLRARPGAEREAEAGRRADLAAASIDAEFGEAAANPLCPIDRLLDRGAWQCDHEFFAAIAGHQVFGPGRLAQDVAHVPEHSVADLVAMGVVHLLEMVDVDEKYGKAEMPRRVRSASGPT